jgi:hypothetical protein
MKWDIEVPSGENQYACLNMECQRQFQGWIESIVREHLLLTGLLLAACAFSTQVAYRMKQTYSSSGNAMWHDDFSLGTSVFLFFMILVAVPLYLQFHPDMV